MAINPIYSDIDINLSKQSDGDIQRDDDVQAIFNSLENIVKTIQGQRRMRPDFVYGPHHFLFEPITESNATRLGEIIRTAVESYEDRIILTNTHISYDTMNNLYTATISFTMKGRGPDKVESISFILKRL